MILRDYEKAKELSGQPDEQLAGRQKRYDSISAWAALAGVFGLVLLFCGDWIFSRATPGFATALPGLYRLVTVLLPGLCIAGFLITGESLKRRRGIVDLARRLKAESAVPKKEE